MRFLFNIISPKDKRVIVSLSEGLLHCRPYKKIPVAEYSNPF